MLFAGVRRRCPVGALPVDVLWLMTSTRWWSTPGRPRTWRVVAATQLRQGLSQRQLSMIALGGVIGAGLFVGSGVVIKDTGPAAFLTHALCGLLVVLVMRLLGEMAAADPSAGSLADYPGRALGGC